LEAVRKILIYTILLVLPELSLADTKDKLKLALEAYESSLYQLSLDSSVSEKAAAIRGLAELGSARYEDARNALLDENEFVIKKALLESIPLMADFSEKSKEFIVDCLKSDSEELIQLACNAITIDPDVTFEFRNLWNNNSLFLLWKKYEQINNCGSVFERLDGIGAARPWNDPVWTKATDQLQKTLLERAGTHSSIELLKQISKPDEHYYVLAEPTDPAALNDLVINSNTSLKLYAALSLIKAKDPDYVQRIHRKVQQLLQEGVNKDNINIDGLDPFFILPILSDDEVRSLALQPLNLDDNEQWQWFSHVNAELWRRGKPFSYEELTSVTFPKVSEHSLRFFRICALVHQQLYSELPSILRELLQNKDQLGENYFVDFKFLSGLPDAVAHECFLELQSQITAGVGLADQVYQDRILRLMGLFARGKDQESLWKKFIHASIPEMKNEISVPVFWGFNQRSARLRILLRSPSKYLPSSDEYYYFGNPTEADCVQPSYLFTTLPFELPIMPESAWKHGLTFVQKVYEIYGHDQDKLVYDFLAIRNVQQSKSDFWSLLLSLNDKRFVVRKLIVHSLYGSFGPLRELSYPAYFYDINNFLNSNRAFLESQRGFTPALPEPVLSTSDEHKFREMLQQANELVFDQKIYNFYNPIESEAEGPPGPSDTPIYAAQPTGFLIQDGSKYLDQLNRLKTKSDDNLRYEALWAIWQLNRDPEILETWMNDATQNDTSATGSYLKARALSILQKIRYKPSMNLFPPLLHDEKPLLRQTALLGVQSFKLYETYDDVKKLLSDPDEPVSETAIETLGYLKSEDAREILIQYLKGTYRQAFAANAALKKYSGLNDIDRMAELLKQSNLSGQQRIMLFDVVSELTFRPEPQSKYWDMKFEKVPVESISNWLQWWKDNRNKSKASWYETADKNLALTLSISKDALEYQKQTDINAKNGLRSIFENFVTSTRKRESVDEAYKVLLNFSEEDFGNPGIAFCSARDRILRDWIQWAKSRQLYSD